MSTKKYLSIWNKIFPIVKSKLLNALLSLKLPLLNLKWFGQMENSLVRICVCCIADKAVSGQQKDGIGERL